MSIHKFSLVQCKHVNIITTALQLVVKVLTYEPQGFCERSADALCFLCISLDDHKFFENPAVAASDCDPSCCESIINLQMTTHILCHRYTQTKGHKHPTKRSIYSE